MARERERVRCPPVRANGSRRRPLTTTRRRKSEVDRAACEGETFYVHSNIFLTISIHFYIDDLNVKGFYLKYSQPPPLTRSSAARKSRFCASSSLLTRHLLAAVAPHPPGDNHHRPPVRGPPRRLASRPLSATRSAPHSKTSRGTRQQLIGSSRALRCASSRGRPRTGAAFRSVKTSSTR